METLNEHFTMVDYVVFVTLLVISTVVGLYYGFFSKKSQNSTLDYLFGGKSMGTIPVSLSAVATFVSGFSMLAVPAEVYSHGSQFMLSVVSLAILPFAMWFIYYPIYYELKIVSLFSYLEQRFDRSVRNVSSLIYIFSSIIFIPVAIYIPALAFSQSTGISVHLITPIAIFICVFYTTFGGVRAVVFTDSIQFVSMVGGVLIVIIMSLQTISFGDVWRAAERGNRFQLFNMDPSPFIRSSFWMITVGLTLGWISTSATNPVLVQRFMALPTLKDLKKALVIYFLGIASITLMSCFVGLLMYAKYETCDPFITGKIKKVDQIVPFFIMDGDIRIPGLPGLFIAGVFSAALSTMSSIWNTLAGTIFEDFIRPRFPEMSESSASNVMKIIVIVNGFLTIGLVFVVERMGTAFELALSIQGINVGISLAIFTFGMVCRNGNAKGVIAGATTGFIVVLLILIGGQSNQHAKLPFRIDGCANVTDLIYNVTNILMDDPKKPFILFQISFLYYGLLGALIVFAIGYPVSICTGGYVVTDERLFTPFRRRSRGYQEEKDYEMKKFLERT